MTTAGSSNAGQAADLVEVVRYYVDKMLREVPGMKVLLLDAETTRVVSTVFSQSEILEQEVYLVERLDADKGDQLFHLKVRDAGCGGAPSWWRRQRRVAAVRQAPKPAVPCLTSLPSVLQAVCFLRPTRENIARMRRELRDPRFGEYHLCECSRPCGSSGRLLASTASQLACVPTNA